MSSMYCNEQKQDQNLQNNSNKCAIELDILVSSTEKKLKAPILNEYKQRNNGKVSIAPDGPIKQQAWVQEVKQLQDQRSENHAKSFATQDIHSLHFSESVSQNLKSEDDRTKSLSRTYHSIKDMISSRFGSSKKDIYPDPKELNNIPEDLRKSDHPIEREGQNKNRRNYTYEQNYIQNPSLDNVQQYLTEHQYNGQQKQTYYQSSQQNLLLPGQLQLVPQTLPSFSGQSAQLHVSHISPLGGVQTVHQTQIATCHQKLQLRNEYKVPESNSISQTEHHGLPQIQQQQISSHGGLLQNITGLNSIQPSSQMIINYNQLNQSTRLPQHHLQSIHQRQILHQMQHQQQQKQQKQQQQQHARQIISKSQLDLSCTLSQGLEYKTEDIYYQYNQGRPKYPGRPQIYIKQDNNQNSEFYRSNSVGCMNRPSSQPEHYYDDVKEKSVNKDQTKKDYLDNFIQKKPDNITDNRERDIFCDEQVSKKLNISSNSTKDFENTTIQPQPNTKNSKFEGKFSTQKQNEESMIVDKKNIQESNTKFGQATHVNEAFDRIGETTKKLEQNYQENLNNPKTDFEQGISKLKIQNQKTDIEQGISKLKIQNQGSGSDYDKAGRNSSNIDSGRGSAIYSSGRKPLLDGRHNQCHDSEWVDIVESELREILEPKDVIAMAHSTLSESVSSVTPPLPPLSPDSPLAQRKQYSISFPYRAKPNYDDYNEHIDKTNFGGNTKQHATSTLKKDTSKKFSHLFGVEVADLTSTTTGLDLESMLDRSDSDLSTNDTRTIRKQLEGLENMYGEVLKLLSGSVKKRKKARGLASYGSVSSLPTSSVSSKPVLRHHDKKRYHAVDDRIKKAKDLKSINKRFQRLESHVVTLARSVAHLSSEMRTQHLMIQEMENIRSEISALRTQTNMAMVRSQSQLILKDSDLPALSNPSRVKKLTNFFGTEPPLIRLFLRELGYEKYATAFENEKVGMVELPYLSEERLQKIGVPLGPRLRILQEARISVCKDPVYVI